MDLETRKAVLISLLKGFHEIEFDMMLVGDEHPALEAEFYGMVSKLEEADFNDCMSEQIIDMAFSLGDRIMLAFGSGSEELN